MPKKPHEGRNIKRIREMLGIKQETLASELEMSQQSVSLLDQKETVDPSLLEAVAKVLKVPVEAIKNFDEEAAIVNIQTNYENANSGSGTIGNNLNYHFCTFNPIDKVIELYERLLQVERDKSDLMKGKQE